MSRSVSLRKRGHRWYARYYDPERPRGNQRCERSLRTNRKDVAERKVVEKRKRFERGVWSPWEGDQTPGPLTLQQGIERFLKDKQGSARTSTVEQYESKLGHFRRDYAPSGIMLRDVAPKHIKGYVHGLKRASDKAPLKPSTKAMRFRHVRAFFNWTVKTGLLDSSPVDDVPQPKAGKKNAAYLKPGDVDTLLRCIDAHRKMLLNEPGPTPNDRWLKQMIRVGVGTGLRRGELLALRWRDVDFDNRMLYVRNRVTKEGAFLTKSGDERPVHLRGDALNVLREMYTRRGDPTGRVFLLPSGTPPKPDRVSKRFKFYVRKAKLPDRDRLKFHSLRHTTASWLARQGVGMPIIAKIMGHSSSRVTEDHYAHISPDVTAKAMDEVFGSE